MKIVFFGTSGFAETIFKALLGSRHKILALVTQPDRKKGRLLKISAPPTKVLALTHAIPVYQPLDASSSESATLLGGLEADIYVVVAFGQILKKTILDLPPLGAINLHSSLLPRYRGAAPVVRAILSGERVTGVSIIKMNERMDEGDIILASKTTIDPEDTAITINEKICEIGERVLLNALDLLERGEAVFVPQDSTLASYAPKLTKEEGALRWTDTAEHIHNMVRGLLPWPGAYTHYEGKVLKILKTRLIGGPCLDRVARPGEVLDIAKKDGIIVRTGSGDIVVQYLQLEGRNILDADAFLRGHPIRVGHIF